MPHMLKLPPSSGSPIQTPSPFIPTALTPSTPPEPTEQPENAAQNQALAQGEKLNVNEPEKGSLAEAPALRFAAAAPAETVKKKPTPKPNKPQPNKKNP